MCATSYTDIERRDVTVTGAAAAAVQTASRRSREHNVNLTGLSAVRLRRNNNRVRAACWRSKVSVHPLRPRSINHHRVITAREGEPKSVSTHGVDRGNVHCIVFGKISYMYILCTTGEIRFNVYYNKGPKCKSLTSTTVNIVHTRTRTHTQARVNCILPVFDCTTKKPFLFAFLRAHAHSLVVVV